MPPGVADHPLWYAWDLACETCLFGLIKEGILSNPVSKKESQGDPNIEHPQQQQQTNQHLANTALTATSSPSLISSPFFTEQLTAFEVWLDYAEIYKGNTDRLESPEQLPVVLQVLLSQVHRVRALELLRRFLELGPWAINLSLSLGIFPYVLKLLQSVEYKSVLVNIWACILKFDSRCQVDLVKDNALGHFIQPLATWTSGSSHQSSISLPEIAKQRTLCAFCLAVTCHRYSQAQKECLRQNMLSACNSLLSAEIKLQEQQQQQAKEEWLNRRASNDASCFQMLEPIAREWLCLCLGNLVQAYPPSQAEAYNSNVHASLMSLQQTDEDVHVRAAASYALGCLFEYSPPSLTSSSSSNSLTGDSVPNTPSSVLAANAGAVGQPSPMSLGPQAFGSIQPSFQSGRMNPEQQQQAHMFSSPQMTSAPLEMNVPTALSSAIFSGQIQPNFSTGMVSGNASGIQLGMAGRPMHGGVGAPILSSQNIAMRQHNQQQGMQSTRRYMGQLHSNQMPQQALPGMQLGSSQQHFQVGPINPSQQTAMIQQQQFFNPTNGSANLGAIIGTAPVNMMAPPNQPTHPIGMPIMGSPAGAAPMMMHRLGEGFSSPDKQHQTQQQTRRRPTVYEDRRRCEFDMKVLDSMAKVWSDCSAVVRYEVVMALSNFVEKYLQAFLVVAEDASRPQDAEGTTSAKNGDRPRVIQVPPGMNQLMMDRIEKCWKALREIQHHDPHPSVSAAADTIVRVIHETLLDMRMEKEAKFAGKKNISGLSEIQEEGEDGMERATSDIHLSGLSMPESRGGEPCQMPQSGGPQARLPSSKLYPLRRSASESAGGNFPATDRSGLSSVPPLPLQNPINRVKAENLLPKSEYYTWKKSMFRPDYDDEEHVNAEQNDPLNPLGAARNYRKRRNIRVSENGRRLANRFVDLAPRVESQKKGIDRILDDEEEEDDERYESLKNDLRVKESRLLRNDPRAGMTAMLKFHSFEDALVSCDNRKSISVWDCNRGERRSFFKNGNPDGSRMTSAFWINETSNSHFFVGCDDGSARVWSGFIEGNGEASKEPPSLSSAFFAVPSMQPGVRGKSGLICEWQQATGTLIAGGSSNHLHCWDLSSEQCFTTLETETKACVTSLATAWDDENPLSSNSNRSMGPDVIVAGHSDGTLKIFDIRMRKAAAATHGRPKNRRKRLTSQLLEHKSWIVDTCFTSYGSRSEIISGSVAGDIRAWDLRMPQSTRAILAQRSPMTAFSVHRKIPMVATGSHAQFIKILTLEGEALQVIRFHEELPGHRIGPVSCLEFHKQRLLLAAGSTNSLVGIYKHDPPQRH
jgi:WD40 repeat protein